MAISNTLLGTWQTVVDNLKQKPGTWINPILYGFSDLPLHNADVYSPFKFPQDHVLEVVEPSPKLVDILERKGFVRFSEAEKVNPNLSYQSYIYPTNLCRRIQLNYHLGFEAPYCISIEGIEGNWITGEYIHIFENLQTREVPHFLSVDSRTGRQSLVIYEESAWDIAVKGDSGYDYSPQFKENLCRHVEQIVREKRPIFGPLIPEYYTPPRERIHKQHAWVDPSSGIVVSEQSKLESFLFGVPCVGMVNP